MTLVHCIDYVLSNDATAASLTLPSRHRPFRQETGASTQATDADDTLWVAGAPTTLLEAAADPHNGATRPPSDHDEDDDPEALYGASASAEVFGSTARERAIAHSVTVGSNARQAYQPLETFVGEMVGAAALIGGPTDLDGAAVSLSSGTATASEGGPISTPPMEVDLATQLAAAIADVSRQRNAVGLRALDHPTQALILLGAAQLILMPTSITTGRRESASRAAAAVADGVAAVAEQYDELAPRAALVRRVVRSVGELVVRHQRGRAAASAQVVPLLGGFATVAAPVLPCPRASPIAYLAAAYSIAPHMVSEWVHRFGGEATMGICEASLVTAPTVAASAWRASVLPRIVRTLPPSQQEKFAATFGSAATVARASDRGAAVATSAATAPRARAPTVGDAADAADSAATVDDLGADDDAAIADMLRTLADQTFGAASPSEDGLTDGAPVDAASLDDAQHGSAAASSSSTPTSSNVLDTLPPHGDVAAITAPLVLAPHPAFVAPHAVPGFEVWPARLAAPDVMAVTGAWPMDPSLAVAVAEAAAALTAPPTKIVITDAHDGAIVRAVAAAHPGADVIYSSQDPRGLDACIRAVSPIFPNARAVAYSMLPTVGANADLVIVHALASCSGALSRHLLARMAPVAKTRALAKVAERSLAVAERIVRRPQLVPTGAAQDRPRGAAGGVVAYVTASLLAAENEAPVAAVSARGRLSIVTERVIFPGGTSPLTYREGGYHAVLRAEALPHRGLGAGLGPAH